MSTRRSIWRLRTNPQEAIRLSNVTRGGTAVLWLENGRSSCAVQLLPVEARTLAAALLDEADKIDRISHT